MGAASSLEAEPLLPVSDTPEPYFAARSTVSMLTWFSMCVAGEWLPPGKGVPLCWRKSGHRVVFVSW